MAMDRALYPRLVTKQETFNTALRICVLTELLG
jgi:hypothetical protein